MASSKNGVHILVFPYPAQGHMLSLLHLTHQLSIRGVAITILVTPKNISILTQLLSANPAIQTLVLPFPEHPKIPTGVENVKDIGNHGNGPIILALSKLEGQLIKWFKSHSNPPVAILSDFFLGWTHHLAEKIRIPRIAFYSSGAFLTACFDSLWRNPEAVNPRSEIKFEDLPNAPSFPWDQVPSLFRRYKEAESDPDLELLKNSMAANGLSWGYIFNTFYELENEYLEFLSKKIGYQRIYSIGPLNLLHGPEQMNVKSDSNNGEVFSWLDGCPDGSVLYVCFGSQKVLKKAQMEALANGLERSGVRFILVAKPLTAEQVAEGFGSVPEGFEQRVVGRGLIIRGWAPQVHILSHRAVGGFLSHCGWNSVLEAIAAGVMILGWPMEADQFVDAKLMVDYLGAAVQVCEDGDTVPDSDELAQKITESMSRDRTHRFKAMDLRDKAMEAVKVGGSSNKDMDRLVKELDQLLYLTRPNKNV
ncbi:UDP-glycosyltransferase 89A2-like [Olea europaea subsp. europaea]|uniref:UDP-glycosyltransferase 89A2-like n=1 Tax=Olea europaea subsp. europaea TaxID=158383 RepID=A0A8S0QJE1_OLEEU|nr:UDP-glycosyltransferase 89A2-like [Olea europaea subsp. europaea]